MALLQLKKTDDLRASGVVDMECRFCRATNAEDDHRCHRCGRRLRMTPVWPGGGEVHASRQSPVPVPVSAIPDYAPQRPSEQAPARRTINWQPSLFSSREMPRVVPFESIAPAPPAPRVQRSTPLRPRTRKPHPGQGTLDLAPAHDLAVETVIYCDAPVALPVHRVLAVALDTGMVALALGLFLLTFRLICGDIILNSHTIPLYLGIAVVLAILYKVLWALADGDSVGLRWAHLKLVNFDGRPPDREQRIYRLASGLLSVLAVGLGLLWALADEESLTWHDHISRTFPTPH
jgi:uncharacterized RDD family membrane protein YckC